MTFKVFLSRFLCGLTKKSKGKFKASHTALENLKKGFPVHERNRVKKLIKKMKKEGILLSKPTAYGEQHRLIEIFLKKK